MAKGGKGYSSGRSSSSSYRIAPTPTPKVHNNIFSTPKKIETPPKKMESTSTLSSIKSSLPPTSSVPSSTSYSRPSSTPSSVPSSLPSSGGFLSNMVDGFSFGVGSSVARNIVDRIFTPSPSRVSSSVTPLPHKQCEELEKSWNECMNLHNQDNNICRKAFEDYETCKRNV